MDNIDDFFQRLVNQHQEKQEQLNTQKISSSSTDNLKIMNSQDDNIEDYLSQIENQQKSDNSSTTENLLQAIESNYQAEIKSPSDNTDELFSQIEDQFPQKETTTNPLPEDSSILDNSIRQIIRHSEKKVQQSRNSSQPKVSQQDSAILDNSIKQIIRHSESKIKQSQAEKKADNLEDIRQEELNKQKQIKQLSRDAETWLKNLDPNSDEGFWFEQFALSYESKQEAAIEYLKALNSEDYS